MSCAYHLKDRWRTWLEDEYILFGWNQSHAQFPSLIRLRPEVMLQERRSAMGLEKKLEDVAPGMRIALIPFVNNNTP